MRRFLIICCTFSLIALACQRSTTDTPTVPQEEEQNLFIGQQLPLNKTLTKIAIGSCNRQDLDQAIWESIDAEEPDLWIWLGDNIYGDTEDMQRLEGKYLKQKYSNLYGNFRKDTPIIGIWDDHDYGVNDGDKNFLKRVESQQLMLDFLDVPKDAPVRSQAGAYQSYVFGSDDKQVKVILLDTRYFRDELERNNGYQRYKPNLTGDILGEAQWDWLSAELSESEADIHFIASGIQMIPEEQGFEKWANFPTARKRLLDLLAETKPNNAILLSGDRHISEFSKLETPEMEEGLYEFTSSGLTHSYRDFSGEPNQHRVGEVVFDLSFGVILIDWSAATPKVSFQMKGVGGALQQELELD
ncbi:MAG: alkaline phosphatase family protein [Saprospiraceae bacterium]|nr:alkaline phosphatase family protein [Saprospiraceae bacterium]